MSREVTVEVVRRKFELLRPLMNERMRRHWAACEALTLERGGITLVAQATGLSRTTVWAGIRELRHPETAAPEGAPPQRIRQAGAGRPLLEQTDPTLVQDLEAFLRRGRLYTARWDESRLEEGFILPGKRRRGKPRPGGGR